MKLSVALCFAGVFGALAAAFIFLSFGTDYWILGSQTCDPKDKESKDSLTFTVSTGLKKAAGQGEYENNCIHYKFGLVNETRTRQAVLLFVLCLSPDTNSFSF